MTRRLCFLLLLSATLWLLPLAQADDPPAASANPALTAADRLYTAGKFGEAADSYQAILKTDPKLVAAQAGLIRCLLREQKVDDAQAMASSALAAQPNSAPLLAAMGDVDFRRAQMPEAEAAYHQALQIDPKQVRAYLGLARLYRVYSLRRHAYDELERAHQLAPDNPEVQRAWFNQLTRKERIAAIESYLAGPHPDNPEETASLQRYLDFLKATMDKPVYGCRLASKVAQTDTKLEAMRRDPTHIFGYGLIVKLNGHDARLELDTGAGGIVISRKFAEKAGLTRISEERYIGLGDKGEQSGYTALAEQIRVGELEFQNCVVHVSDRASMAGEDGFIGGNVFASYLIDIDIPDQKLRLSPLPKRPDEPETTPSLQTEEEHGGADEKSEADADQTAEPTDTGKSTPVQPARRLPMDRYVAPEMARWTPVFRFGHAILIPTHVNDSPSMLFMIDTGSNVDMLSQRAAKQVTKISIDPNSHIKGISGNVEKVYRASQATLMFGHLAQKNQNMVTVDLSNISRRLGTEVSGFLGFDTLHMLQLKIDYRDGLVDFVYDASRWH
ncbi:MAG: aspartyl protease family protein [Candidatus Korobacteraceae bacterium]|jgi:tetratricopeptide (TPR) repeat protein